jgi:hypothetical protein
MASYLHTFISLHCICGSTHQRQPTTSVYCACGFIYTPMWFEFPQATELKDQEADRQAFLCLPFSLHTLYPCLPCQPLLKGEEEKEVEVEEEEGTERHPFWIAIQNARDETVEEEQEVEEGMAPSQDDFARRLHELCTEVRDLRIQQDLLRARCVQNKLLD